jgi:hypothetical protein
LQKVIASENNRELGSKKALSFPDLLIKVCLRANDHKMFVLIVVSPFRESASTLCSSMICVDTRLYMMIQRLMPNWKRLSFVYRRPYAKSTRPKMIPKPAD